MCRSRKLLGSTTLLCLLQVLFVPIAWGQNTLTVADVVAAPGDTGVVVQISSTTEVPLSLLSFDITFGPELCPRIVNQQVRRAGRALREPQEGGLRCPAEGRVSVVMIDLLGGTILPVGSGVVAEWVFDVNGGAAEGEFDLGVVVKEFRNGPVVVPVESSGGHLSIMAPPGPTPTPTPTVTACVGDCSGNGEVSALELFALTYRNVFECSPQEACGDPPVLSCANADGNSDGSISALEIFQATQNSAFGCPE